MDMQRVSLIGLLLVASLAMAQQTSSSQQPAQQPAPASQASQQPAPDAPDATKTQQQTDPTDQTDQPEKPTKPKPGFKDLKHHFSSWCVGAPVNRCYEKQEDADAAEASAKKQKSEQKQPPVPENQPLPRSGGEPAADESSSRSTL